MRFYRPGFFERFIYREGIFRFPGRERLLCLSFDDGPCPGSTEQILGLLCSGGIRALFFCTGAAAEANPRLMNRIRSEGHLIGNHGYRHLDGFRTPLSDYCNDAAAAEPFTSSRIFRPPYGRLTIRQYNVLKKRYRIVFWDIMPYDFDSGLSPSGSLDILKKRIRPGSVIVLHDTSGSSAGNYLGEFIDHALTLGYRFDIPAGLIQ